MILELADFRISLDATDDFETAMEELKTVIASIPGYQGHTIQRSMETPGRYVLLVRWATLEDHTQGFRGSVAFETWRSRLGAHRDGAVVEHLETVLTHEWNFRP
ncbi:MAG: antibiotic biosynthesis monooxygenase [Pleurocapsa sp. SU_196_0]|nr:antibiotic biosynthesis monooxygenase [Pleurocapsa sp. SU_196_0]